MAVERVPTSALAGLTLVAGFAVAQATHQVLGGAVLLAGATWCVLREARRTAWWRIGVVLVVAVGAFVGAHLLADTLGAWPAVVLAALVLMWVSYPLVDRGPLRRRVTGTDRP